MKPAIVLAAVLASIGAVHPIRGQDWITAPSNYTHDAQGLRVRQHTPIGPFFIHNQADLTRSGYRHTRSSLQFGGSVDHYHSVEEWGRPVQPYDEWRFPFRPYSAPYPEWGPPYAGLGYGRYHGFPFPGGVPFVPGLGAPGGGFQPFVPYQGFQPWFDDRYPAFDDRAQFRREPFPVVPP